MKYWQIRLMRIASVCSDAIAGSYGWSQAMRVLTPTALLIWALLLIGCTKTQQIDRPTLLEHYQATQLAEGTRSIVPLRLEPNAKPPTVVNWWYAGTANGQHHLVYRQLTWDNDRKPVGQEVRYRIAADQFTIAEAFAPTDDAARWLALYEAAPQEIEPPADLPTTRKAPKPVTSDPIRLPDESVLTPSD